MAFKSDKQRKFVMSRFNLGSKAPIKPIQLSPTDIKKIKVVKVLSVKEQEHFLKDKNKKINKIKTSNEFKSLSTTEKKKVNAALNDFKKVKTKRDIRGWLNRHAGGLLLAKASPKSGIKRIK